MNTTSPPDNTRVLSLTCIWMVLVLSACTPAPPEEHHDAQNQPSKASESERPMSQAEQDRRIDYVEFLTTNMEGTKRFYSGIFGWTFTDYGPDYASFNDGRLSGGFAVAPGVRSGGPLVVLYAVDLDALVPKVGEYGGRITRETYEFPGGRRFHFADPSGNELAVWSDQ
jgi:predicted enzyme related to lactoylglutathione lyase